SLNERAHHIAETLQRALLPDRLPEIPGVALAARYLPGGPGTDVGGDWYDVVPYPDGKVGLVMGDVVRRGIGAAPLMGQLRAAVSAGPVDPDALCEHVLHTLLPQGPPGDDVALLALRNLPIAGPHLHLELPADPDELAVVRRSVERWLASSAVDERDAYRVTL